MNVKYLDSIQLNALPGAAKDWFEYLSWDQNEERQGGFPVELIPLALVY